MKRQIHLVSLKKYLDSNNQEVEIDLHTDAIVIDEEEKTISFFEKDKTKQVIRINKDKVIIERIGHANSKIIFIKNQNTPYELSYYSRTINLDIYTEKIEVKQNYLEVVYQTEIDISDHAMHQICLWF